MNLKFPRKVESGRYLGQFMDFLVDRLQRSIIGS